jgi:hypothetical protein
MVKILNFWFFNQVVHFITHGRIELPACLAISFADKKFENKILFFSV